MKCIFQGFPSEVKSEPPAFFGARARVSVRLEPEPEFSKGRSWSLSPLLIIFTLLEGNAGRAGKFGLDGRDGLPGEPGLDGVPGQDTDNCNERFAKNLCVMISDVTEVNLMLIILFEKMSDSLEVLSLILC